MPRQDASEERLPPERLAAILRRLQEGFYDQEDVRGTIAQRVLAEIGSGPEE